MVTGVVARPHDGDPVEIAADVVVGADGLRSVVASRVGAPVERIGTGASGFLYGYWTGVPVDGYEWYYRPGVMAGMFPTNDGRTCVAVGAPAARVRQLGPAGFGRLLAEADPSAHGAGPGGRRRTDACARSPRRPATTAAPSATAGRWSATPATGRTRWACTA